MSRPIKTLFLHIGGEKTGTTTLQVFLRDHAAQLRARGLIYPSGKQPYFSGKTHAPLVAGLIKDEAICEFIPLAKLATSESAMNSLLRSLRSCDAEKAVISAEHFSSRLTKSAHLIELKNALLQVSECIKVVFYLREQVGLSASAYSTAIRNGRRTPFDVKEVDVSNPYFNHLSTLDLWSSVFGKENLILREYDRKRLLNENVIDDFFNIIGIPIGSLAKPPRLNESLDTKSLELIREFNLVLPTPDESLPGFHEANRLRKHLLIPHLKVTSTADIGLKFSDRMCILDRFKHVNETINSSYMNDSLTQSWFSPDCVDDGSCHQVFDRGEIVPAICQAYLSLAKLSQQSLVPRRTAVYVKVSKNLRRLVSRH